MIRVACTEAFSTNTEEEGGGQAKMLMAAIQYIINESCHKVCIFRIVFQRGLYENLRCFYIAQLRSWTTCKHSLFDNLRHQQGGGEGMERGLKNIKTHMRRA